MVVWTIKQINFRIGRDLVFFFDLILLSHLCLIPPPILLVQQPEFEFQIQTTYNIALSLTLAILLIVLEKAITIGVCVTRK